MLEADEFTRLVRKHGVLLDANVLLLRLAATFDLSLVGHGRLDIFSAADELGLEALTAGSPRTITTPHVLTEVVNLAMRWIPRKRHYDFRAHAAESIRTLPERHVPASDVVAHPLFLRLGLTDAGIAQLRLEQVPVVSVDAPLIEALSGLGVPVLNLYNLRGT